MKTHEELYNEGIIDTTDGEYPQTFDGPAPDLIKENGQHKSYWVLSEAERAKGFIRPVRQTYYHTKCEEETRMGLALAETYARQPSFYGATFCCVCRNHFPVSEFLWIENGKVTNEILGT